MDCGIYRDPARFYACLTSAKDQLRSIRSRPCPDPAPGSHTSLVFDPFVARRLNSFGPLRTHALPPQEQVWEAMSCFLDDWGELRLLCSTTSIMAWEVGRFVFFLLVMFVLNVTSDAWTPSSLATPPEISVHSFIYTSKYVSNHGLGSILIRFAGGVFRWRSNLEQVLHSMARRAFFFGNAWYFLRYLRSSC
jgi:hypothetical protein